MSYLQVADNQAVSVRPGGAAIWLTDIITPNNPDVMLLYNKLTDGLNSQIEKVIACWRYVSAIPYRETVSTRFTIQGKSYSESDTWLYPGEVIRLAPVANCANKSFLMASLLLNEMPESSVKCALGHITLDGIGAHAWVTAELNSRNYIIETTTNQQDRAFMPIEKADAYDPIIVFNNKGVQAISNSDILNEHLGFCAVEWLRDYVCERCVELTLPSG
jgi:hypothetical protein